MECFYIIFTEFMFISFDKTSSKYLTDLAESLGNKLLYPVTQGFGTRISVKPVLVINDITIHGFSVRQKSLCKRICCVIACILLAPIILLMTLIGVIAYNCSATYQFTCQRLYIYGLEFDRSSSSKLEEV